MDVAGAPIDDLAAQLAQVVGMDLRQQPLLPDWTQLAIEDRPAHGARAVRHLRLLQPAIAELPEALRLPQPALLALLLLRGREAVGDHPAGVDALFPRPRQREASGSVPAKH
jgi:hypothetical protein